MIWVILALCGGILFGLFVTALMVAASDADDAMEKMFDEERK